LTGGDEGDYETTNYSQALTGQDLDLLPSELDRVHLCQPAQQTTTVKGHCYTGSANLKYPSKYLFT
jgi:hypothetical protein